MYEQRIVKLAADYRDRGVAVIAIQPNAPEAIRVDELDCSDLSDSLEEMKIRASFKHLDYRISTIVPIANPILGKNGDRVAAAELDSGSKVFTVTKAAAHSNANITCRSSICYCWWQKGHGLFHGQLGRLTASSFRLRVARSDDEGRQVAVSR
jgi:hypothetical protein